jgi:hypothetical protein
LVVTAALGWVAATEWAAGLGWVDMDSRAALGWVALEWAPIDSAGLGWVALGWAVMSSAAGDLVDLVSQWESITLHANIIASGSANMIGSGSANIAWQVGMLNIALGVL